MAVTERAASLVAVGLSIIALLVDSVAAATLTGKADVVDGDTIKVGAASRFGSTGSTLPKVGRPVSEMARLRLRQRSHQAARKSHRRTES